MNAATEFDVGPLTWVKSEIDLALERADKALQQYKESVGAGADDLTHVKFSRTHLHQVQGALTIVGLDGVTRFAEALEFMLESIEQGSCPSDESVINLARRSLAAIGRFLDDLISGMPNQPLRLLSLYREVQQASGLERVSATDLFFPDLTARPPRRDQPPKKVSPADYQRLLRQERARFQRGFLAWLRSPQDRGGISEMLGAVRRIEDVQETTSVRSFWWVATGFLSALAEGALPEETNVKQLCARIDLQIRRLIEGSKNVAERLMRDALFFVASADSNNNTVRQVKKTYQLSAMVPTEEAAVTAQENVLRRRLRDAISATEESWNKYCAGTMQALPLFSENVGLICSLAEQLAQTDFRRLAQSIQVAAKWLVEDSARHTEALAMEVATAVLLAQNAHENFQKLGNDFAHQVDVTVARIHSCIAGSPPTPGSEIPLLDEMSRQAQERLLVAQVAKEIQSNLAQIEQVLDGFFRDAERHAELASLNVPLRQVVGALTMMRHDGAVKAVQACAEEIQRFSADGYVATESDFERVAGQLSMIGFFIDSLPHGTAAYEQFVAQMQPSPDKAGEDESENDESDEHTDARASVEQALTLQKMEAHALLGALREQPNDAGLRAEIKQSLVALKDDADLVADSALGAQTKAMLTVLETGEDATPQIDQVMAALKPQTEEPLVVSAETLQLSQSSNEDIDAELLEIFLEEANEVLGTIEENLGVLKEQPLNLEVLTTIRRSFHTLKGSGRMVGLKDVGEAAWAVEQTLNLWLRKELAVGAPLLDLLDLAHSIFVEWVKYLESGSGQPPDPSRMAATAEALRSADDEGVGAAKVPTAMSPVPVDDVAAPAECEEPPAIEAVELVALPEPDLKPGAEIISLEFPSSQPVVPSVDEAPIFQGEADFQGVDIPQVEEFTAQVVEEQDRGNEPLVSDSDMSGSQLRISISPILFEIFSDEAHAHLGTLQRELSVLERNESAPTPHDMYRAAHTLAGISATVGVNTVNQLGLALEHALLRRDNSPQLASLEALGVIRQAVGEIDLMLSALADQHEPAHNPALISALEELYPTALLVQQQHDEGPAAPEPAAISEVPPQADSAKIFEAGAEAPSIPAIQQLRDEIDEQLLPIFLDEAVDLNQGITSQLRAWRGEPASAEIVRTLLRLLHTLKGSARMAGAMNLGEITHAIEARVEQVGRADSVSPEVIDEIDSAFDSILQIVERLQRGEHADQVLAAAQVESVRADTAPSAPLDSAVRLEAPVVERRADRTRFAEADVESEAEAAAVQRITLRVRADLIDRLVNEAGELSIARTRIEGEMRSLKDSLLDLTENVIRLRRQLREIEIQAESQMQSRNANSDEVLAEFDPLEFDRFTRFQELTRMMAESVNDVSTVQQNLLKNLDDANAAIIAQARLNREVQQELMAVRMVPFGSLADRLYRIVRQTSKELNKRANLEISGSQVELDRSVLDKIAAPLEHMLRNAVAHGLEEREVRIACGKPDIGEISLSLKQEGNEIILSFADDGAGLDFERIKDRAIAHGVLSPDEDVDQGQLAELIFTPGFSTASEVSQIAGRGVGMDVVKTEVTSLGGRIEIISSPGKGTEFRLYIPLTLAVTKALLVRAGNKSYAIPSAMIEQVLDLKEAALARIREAGTAEWMGHHYPFSYLPHLLGDTQALPEQHRQYWTLLLRSGARRISVQVDELLGNQEIVVKNIGPQLARVIGVDGATVLGNGQVVLILNPVALSSRSPVAEFVVPVPAAPSVQEKEATAALLPTVMVVDDSLTVRKITGRLLAREGYQVLIAKDGVEALEQLLDVVPDVMLVDIEMPRMDGFDLTRNIRADERLKNIPIIMITSRTADKHRTYAFEIGVNHYLGKPYQEEELLALVAGYVEQQRAIA
jgi:chemosensory pili system protein ChpA (sensor histidine kinase/response regulator)